MEEKTDLEKIMEVLASFDDKQENNAIINNIIVEKNEVKRIISTIEKPNIEEFIKELEKLDTISTSAFQRYLKIGFSNATKIIDYLEVIKAISTPDEKTKQRKIISAKDIIKTLVDDKDD